jgi:hypothetical protein
VVIVLTSIIGMVPMAVPETPSRSFAGLLGSILLIGTISIFGKMISSKFKYDDIIRIIVTVLTAGAIIASIPLIQALGQLLQYILTKLAELFHLSSVFGAAAAFIVTAVFAIWRTIVYFNSTKSREKSSFGPFIWMIAALIPLFGVTWMSDLSRGVIDNICIPVFNIGNTILSFLQNLAVSITLPS